MLDVQRSGHAAALLAVLGISPDVVTPGLDSADLALACTLAAYTGDRDLRSRLSLLHAGDLMAHGSLVAAAEAAAEAAGASTTSKLTDDQVPGTGRPSGALCGRSARA